MKLQKYLSGFLAVALCATTLSAQTSRPAAPSARQARTYVSPKTPWGDPDLQGTYTNKDESGIPFERTSRFAGKTTTDVDDEELRELIAERAKAAVERGPG